MDLAHSVPVSVEIASSLGVLRSGSPLQTLGLSLPNLILHEQIPPG